MIPATPGIYEFKGSLHSISEWVNDKDYFDWSHTEVYINDTTQRLCARVFDEDGHYSAAFIGQFSGEWRQPSHANHV